MLLEQLVKEIFTSRFIIDPLAKVPKNLIKIVVALERADRGRRSPKSNTLRAAIEIFSDRLPDAVYAVAASLVPRERYVFYIVRLLYCRDGFWTQPTVKPIVRREGTAAGR